MHRWLKWLALPLVLLAAGALLVRVLLEPTRLSAFLLERASEITGLELRLQSPADIGFWPDLHLQLQGLSAHAPGAATPMLRVREADLSLPWRSLTGDAVTLQHLRLIEPVFDWAAFNAWQLQDETQTGPPAPPRLPTFDAPVEILGARIKAPDFRIENLNLMLPHLIENTPVTVLANGSFVRGDEVARKFALQFDTTPAWNIGKLRLAPLRLSVSSGDSPTEAITLDGELEFDGQRLNLTAHSQLPHWPPNLPALPLPQANDANVKLDLNYSGSTALQGDASLTLQRGNEAITAALRLGDIATWLQDDAKPMLPPLQGSINAQRLHIDGIDIEGFKLRMDDSSTPTP